MTFITMSSYGEITCDLETGEVVSCLIYDGVTEEEANNSVADVTKVDVAEWQTYYGKVLTDGDEVDILDVGFYHGDGEYEKPDYTWREMVRPIAKESACVFR